MPSGSPNKFEPVLSSRSDGDKVQKPVWSSRSDADRVHTNRRYTINRHLNSKIYIYMYIERDTVDIIVMIPNLFKAD